MKNSDKRALGHDWRKLSREHQILIYTICTIEQLKAEGHVSGSFVRPTDASRKAFAEMQAEGFVIDRDDVIRATEVVESYCELPSNAP